MKHSGIYKITNAINSHFYVGSSVNIKKRWNRHLEDMRKGTHNNCYLQNAYNKYGESNFVFSVIEYCDIGNLIAQEQKYIDELHPEYNLYPVAGSPLGTKHSIETRQKMSITRKGRTSPLKGKSPSKEHRQRIGDANRGKPKHPRSPEHCLKISNARKAWWKHKKETDNICVH